METSFVFTQVSREYLNTVLNRHLYVYKAHALGNELKHPDMHQLSLMILL